MGLCWYCHWGWPKAVRGVYNKAAASLTEIDSGTDALIYGPSHIVWDDENFDDGSIDWCLKACVGATGYSPDEVEIVRRSLEELSGDPASRARSATEGLRWLEPGKISTAAAHCMEFMVNRPHQVIMALRWIEGTLLACAFWCEDHLPKWAGSRLGYLFLKIAAHMQCAILQRDFPEPGTRYRVRGISVMQETL